MQTVLNLIKKVLGEKLTVKIRPLGHGIKAYLGALYYGFPGKKVKLIGINGTKGKTTTAILVGKILNILGIKTGFVSGALIFDGENEFANKLKLSTNDALDLQKLVSRMVRNNCKIIVIELTSQGLEQRRHLGLGSFDTTVFLNAYPEHLEAHGGWGKYIKAKSLMFKHTAKNGHFIGNYDHDQLETTQKLFHSIPFKIRKTVKKNLVLTSEFKANLSPDGIHRDFEYKGKVYPTNLMSEVELIDLFFALKTAQIYFPKIEDNLSTLIPQIHGAPGRMDWVVLDGIFQETNKKTSDGAKNNEPHISSKSTLEWKNKVSILVDYAHEPESMKRLLETIQIWKKRNIYTQVIHILSSDGAGRDIWKRQIHGDLSYKNTDFTVLTTDNYTQDDNPEDILNELGQNFEPAKEGVKFKKIIKRQKAFEFSLNLAKDYISKNSEAKILIFSTGVGTESGLTQPEGIMEWNEKRNWQETFANAV